MYTIASFVQKIFPPEACKRIYSFLISQQNPDGGFRGRGKASDLYYAAFAIASLMAIGKSIESRSFLEYLAKFEEESLDFIHLCSLLRCHDLLYLLCGSGISIEKKQKTFLEIEKYRSMDGGYNHEVKHGSISSVYGCFLAHQAYSLSGQPFPASPFLASCLKNLQASDGSYSNEPGLKTGNTTATSAAMILLSNTISTEEKYRLVSWLLLQRHSSGGFYAAPKASIPDMLSTSVALYALTTLKYSLKSMRLSCLEFIESHWEETGGFLGTLLDPVADCEYTFYALLALGSLYREE
ncbi:MAG: terpene cyclase/mutase family protein [Candidatus Brocadiae bacterium]|nr:terpene cyclase/mutase family protein [Candidatus Brocadiia bacterium]